MNAAALYCGLFALVLATDETKSGTLVVLNKSDADVTFHNPTSGEELVSLPVGIGPHEAATSPDGSLVVVCNYGERTPGQSLTTIDTKKREVLATIDLAPYHRPHGIQFLPGGKRVVVTAEVEKKLLIVDLERGEVVAAIDTDQAASHMVAVAPGGERAYVANIGSGSVTVIDLKEARRLANVPTGAGAEGIAVHPKSGDVWITNRAADTVSVLDAETLEVRKQIDCGAFPIRAAFTPDGRRCLVSCAKDDEVQIYDGATGELVSKVSMTAPSVEDAERAGRIFGADSKAQAMPIGILVEPGGERAYIANTMADIVTVIDIESAKVLRRISTGRQPDGMTWVP